MDAETAFATGWSEHAPRLRKRIAVQLDAAGFLHELDDVMGEIALRAWSFYRPQSSLASFEPWMKKVAQTVITRRVSKLVTRSEHEHSFTEIDEENL